MISGNGVNIQCIVPCNGSTECDCLVLNKKLIRYHFLSSSIVFNPKPHA